MNAGLTSKTELRSAGRVAIPSFRVVLFFVGLAGLLCALILGFELDRLAPNTVQRLGAESRHLGMNWYVVLTGGICGLTALGLVGWRLLRWWPKRQAQLRRFAIPTLATLCVLGCTAFFYLSPRISKLTYVSGHDSLHYLLGAKYFAELQYVGLYECIAVADREGRRMLQPRVRIRDLHTYKLVPVQSVFEGAAERCGEAFSAARWVAFKSDVDAYQDFLSRKEFLTAVSDHGYNGSPFHTVVAGTVANLLGNVSYPKLVGASLIDTLGLLAMFAAITLAYGWRWGLLFTIFFVTAFTDRFYLLGGSFMRYWWMIPLGMGIAALHRGRHALAGVCMTLAAMFNVFPVLFCAGIGVRMLAGLIRNRRLSRAHSRFLIAAVVTLAVGVLLGILSGQQWGNYRAFLDNMGGHTDIVTSSRVGFRYLFLFRGEIFATDPAYSISLKEAELDELAPVIWSLAILCVAGCAWVVRRLRDEEAALLLGMTTFYFLFGTVGYYFAVYALLVLMWAGHLDKPWAYVLLCAQWALMLLVHLAWLTTGYGLFVYNTVLSATIGLYLVASIVFFARAGVAESAAVIPDK